MGSVRFVDRIFFDLHRTLLSAFLVWMFLFIRDGEGSDTVPAV